MQQDAQGQGSGPDPTITTRSIATMRIAKPAIIDKPIVADWHPRRMKPETFPDQPQNQGAPPSTIANVEYLLTENGVEVRYNVVKKKSEIVIPGLAGVSDNADNVSIAHVKSLLALHGMQHGDARGIVDAIANRHPYNPAAEWILSRPWDKIDRFPAFYDTLGTVADYPVSLKQAIMYRWILSAAAAALLPSGFSTRLVLTLQGPQSIGKTRWCMSLVPDPVLRAAVVKTDHHFDGGNKDNLITAVRFWIVEMGEVESSFRKDQERVKGILTRDRDVVRLPYAAAESEFPRRTVFMASANSSDFLIDPTGSTRWGVIAVETINYEHGIDMQQLFAQAAVALGAGEKWWFDSAQEAELEAWNERHQATSLIREDLAVVVDFEGDDTLEVRRLSASELLRAVGVEFPTTQQARECGALLRKAFGPPRKTRGIWRWDVPLRSGVLTEKLPESTRTKSKFD